MGYAITSPPTKPRRATSCCLEKTASGDFFKDAVISHQRNPLQPIKTRQKNRLTPTKTALGVHFKNYLDHVYAVSDDSGSIVEHYRYSAFGEVEIYSPAGVKLAVSAIDNGVLLNSRRFNTDTGLYYYWWRHYKANVGRWLGRDPIGSIGGMNLYGFVGNEPLNYLDVLGMFPKNSNRKGNIRLGDGWTAAKDPFNRHGKARFEMHVFNPQGKEVGVCDEDGFFKKHGHKSKVPPPKMPLKVKLRLDGKVVAAARARGLIPAKGLAGSGAAFKNITRSSLGPAGIVSAIWAAGLEKAGAEEA